MTSDTKNEEPRIPQDPQNIILYGPPGTGKTYGTRRRAIQLLGYDITGWNEDRVRTTFQQFTSQSTDSTHSESATQIEFITFHQSYGYEDFVEGFRPSAREEQEPAIEGSGRMEFRIEPGVFRRIVQRALDEWTTVHPLRVALLASVTLSTAPIGKEDTRTCWHAWQENRSLNARQLAAAINKKADEYGHAMRAVLNVLDQIIASVPGQEGEPYSFDDLWVLLTQSVGRGNICKGRYLVHIPRSPRLLRVSGFTTYDDASLYADRVKGRADPAHNYLPRSYVLIIDEINRSNVSKVFGELITLIEPSKRVGEPDELAVRLPYSREVFCIPPNLHILGTMNTADRSIALLDVALRRRFQFEELMPDAQIVKRVIEAESPGRAESKKNLAKLASGLLSTLNARLSFVYDRDHQIGHAYLLDVRSLVDLRDAVRYRIVPLIQEYFYNDWRKVCAVLGQDPNEIVRPGENRLISIRVAKEKAVLGLDHEEYMDQKEYSVDSRFYGDDERVIEEMLKAVIDPARDGDNEEAERPAGVDDGKQQD